MVMFKHINNINKLLYIFYFFSFLACNNDIHTDISNEDNKTYLKVNNNSGYAVNVYIDVPPLFNISPENKWRIYDNSFSERELQPTALGENGSTLYFEYLIPIGNSFIPYYPNNVDFVKLIKLEKAVVNIVDIPLLSNLQLDLLFPDSTFILIKNNSKDIIWLQSSISTLYPYDSIVRDILPSDNAFFLINASSLANFTIGNTSRWNFPYTILEKGYIYEFIIMEGETLPKIIPDSIWQIRSKITSTWKKEISRYNASNFSDSKLNTHLNSIIRRLSISNWRSNYPVSKIIYDKNQLINCEMKFGVIPLVIQNTGIVNSYELTSFSVSNTELSTHIVPSRNISAIPYPSDKLNPTNIQAYNTIFNDVVKLRNTYIVLTTYSINLRSGLCLFFLNEQGQTINSFLIEPNNNLESYIGTKLVKIDNDSFLILGSKLKYINNNDEHFIESSMIISKHQIGNYTEIWLTEYMNPSHYANLAICGLTLNDDLIICGTVSDNSSTKTLILKINKINGDIINIKNIGTASESIRPFSIYFDNENFIYITGIATEGTTSKAYILKLNSSLSEIWFNKYGNYYDNFLFDLVIRNNLIVAVGSCNNGSINNPMFYGWQEGSGWIIKIDTNSGIILKEIFDNSLSSFNSIINLSDDSFVLSAVEGDDINKPYLFNTYAVKINRNLER